jgi:hypothetical protein
LYKFLDKEVLRVKQAGGQEGTEEEEFPYINDSDALVKLMRWVWRLLLMRALKKVAGTVAGVGMVLGGVWWAVYRR